MKRKVQIISRDAVPKMDKTFIYFDSEGYFYVGDYFEYQEGIPMDVEIDIKAGKDYYFIKPLKTEPKSQGTTIL